MKVAAQLLEVRQHPPYPKWEQPDREGPTSTAISAVTWVQGNRTKSVLLELNLNILGLSNIHVKPEAAIQVFYLNLFCRWCQDLLQMQTSEMGKIFFFFFIQADLVFMVSVEKEEKTMITANEFLN